MKNWKNIVGAAALLVSTFGVSISANAAMITQEAKINGETILTLGMNLDEDILAEVTAVDDEFNPTAASNFFYPDLLTLESVSFFGVAVDLANVFQFDAVFNALDLSEGLAALTIDVFAPELDAGVLFAFDRANPDFNLATFDIAGEITNIFGDEAEFSVVPEPSAFAVFALAMGLMMVRRQRR